MSTLAQAPDGDLLITNGQITIVSDINEALALKLRNKFRLFLGEWFLDTRVGVPWFEAVLVKAPDLGVIKQIFTQVILGTEGMASVEEMVLDFDNAARELDFTFRALTDSGAIISGGAGQPFIVETN